MDRGGGGGWKCGGDFIHDLINSPPKRCFFLHIPVFQMKNSRLRLPLSMNFFSIHHLSLSDDTLAFALALALTLTLALVTSFVPLTTSFAFVPLTSLPSRLLSHR